jgi:hypothetical protein
VPVRASARKKRKPVARKRRAPAEVSGLPAYALADNLSRLRRQSCEEARRDIELRTAPKKKREVFESALSSWANDTYKLVLDELKNHLQHAIAKPGGQSDPLIAFRWAEEQVSLALAHGLGYTRLYENKKRRTQDEALLRTRLSSLGTMAKRSAKRNKQGIEDDLTAGDGALGWLREYSSEWVKLACDDPADGVWALFEWRAPAWAVESESASDRATAEETENLLNDAAARLRDSLENARFDAFASLREQKTAKPSRNFTTPQRQAIERIGLRNPVASIKEIADMLDQQKPRVPILSDWLSFQPEDERTWTRALGHELYRARVKKMISEVRSSSRR